MNNISTYIVQYRAATNDPWHVILKTKYIEEAREKRNVFNHCHDNLDNIFDIIILDTKTGKGVQ